MKTFIVLATTTVVGGAMGLSVTPSWAAAVDARPEALVMGACLLLLAALIRHGTAQKFTK